MPLYPHPLQPQCLPGSLPGSPEPLLFLSLSPSSWPSAFCCVCCRLSLWQTSKACPTVRTIRIAWLWGGAREKTSEGHGDSTRPHGGSGQVGRCKGRQSESRQPGRNKTGRPKIVQRYTYSHGRVQGHFAFLKYSQKYKLLPQFRDNQPEGQIVKNTPTLDIA